MDMTSNESQGNRKEELHKGVEMSSTRELKVAPQGS
jgi:hypothetical protein